MMNTKFKDCVSRITMEARKVAMKEYKPDPASDGVINFDIDLYHQKIVEMVVRDCMQIVDDDDPYPYDSFSDKIKKYFGVTDED